MKILENPHIQIRCPSCNALLGVEVNDIYYNDVGEGPTYSCTCAGCGKQIPLTSNMIPYDWILQITGEQ